ncbi:conjugal transfer protein TraG N-terminal domain-containing protein [Aeromonas hydrophila]|uniref:conjugal transfer protein TraG N-terminal domain-containing protein n=1 Tax=Aeromonas hydrophila TaxID=644 RepID=UPI00235EA0E7|nr:conjugal transfer protein TraG N-terminal domain-containing protein [Aeromonas hydrophila]
MAFAAGALSDMDYVVSGGFTTYVNAFTRLKYIFADSEYSAMVVSMVVMAIPVAMLAMVGKATVEGVTSGKPSLNFGWLALWFIGSIVYRGTMVPTSTIHIYDQDRNLYQPVAGVPSVMVLAAGVTNRFTQVFRDVVMRNSASTDRLFGEGAPIKMFSALVTGTGTPFDPYLKRNITEFWHSCADIAAQTNGTTFDRAKILTGSNRLLADLAPLANPAVYSEWYSATAPYNSTVTCTDAYNKIKTAMAVSGSAGSGPFGARIKSVCEQTGYSSTNSAQLADCATQMEKAVQDIFGDSALTLTVASQNIMLAQAINDSLLQDNPNAALKQLVNRSMVNAGIADATGSPEWISEIKAGVVSVVLAMMPILIMLVVTPFIGKALTLVLGLWIFIAAWDIADIMLLQAANDQIYTVMDELRRSKMGLDMLTLAPTASMKALSVLAASREHAMQMALIIAGIFGVSAYSMQSLGNRLTANLDKANDAAADRTLTPEGRGELLAGTTRGVAESMAHGQIHNIESMANPQAFNAIREATSVAATSSALGGIPQAAQRSGSMSAAQDVGRIQGIGTPSAALGSATVSAEREVGGNTGTADAAKATGQTVATMSRQNAAVSTEREVGANAGTVEAAKATGHTVATMSQQNTAVSSSAETGRNVALLGSAGTLSGVSEQAEVITSDQTATAVGGAQGRELAAQDLGMSKTEMAASSTHANTASQTVEGQRQIEAARTTTDSWAGVNKIESAAKDAALKQFGKNPDAATAHQSQLLAEGVSQASGRQEVYGEQGGLERVNHAAGVSHAADNAGTADALDQSPNAVQGLAQASSNRTAEQIGRGNTLGNKAVPAGARTGGIQAQETLANNHVYDMLNAAGFSDRELAQAKANNHVPLSVNAEQAAKLHESGLLNKQQYQAIKDNGSGAMLLDLAQDDAGHLLASTQVSAGDSTSIDNSWTQDDSRRVNKDDVTTRDVTQSSRGFTEDPSSNRRSLSDKEHLLKLINSNGLEETGKDFANAGGQVLATILSESVTRENIATAGVGGALGVGTEGGGASANASAALQAQSVDSSTINTQRTIMQTAWDNAVSEGRGKHGLQGEDLNRFVASRAADQFERAYTSSDKYARDHKGDSAAAIVAATPQPENAAALGKGGSEFYGPGATLAHVYKPTQDPANQESTRNALEFAQGDTPQQSSAISPSHADELQRNAPVTAALPDGPDVVAVTAGAAEPQSLMARHGDNAPQPGNSTLMSSDAGAQGSVPKQQAASLPGTPGTSETAQRDTAAAPIVAGGPDVVAVTAGAAEPQSHVAGHGDNDPQPGNSPTMSSDAGAQGNATRQQAAPLPGTPGVPETAPRDPARAPTLAGGPDVVAVTAGAAEPQSHVAGHGDNAPQLGNSPTMSSDAGAQGNIPKQQTASLPGTPGTSETAQRDTAAAPIVAGGAGAGAVTAGAVEQQSSATGHVDNVLQSGRYSPESREQLTENFAHAQNQLAQVAEERGLSENWVNANMRQYADTVINAPKGAETQAAADVLADAGVNISSSSMPPIPASDTLSSSSQMPPIDEKNYRDGVNGF